MNQGRDAGLRTVLIVLIGQVGCVTLAVIALSVVVGLWLDGVFHTGRVITLALLLAGIPISVILMLFLSRRSLSKMQADAEKRDSTKP